MSAASSLAVSERERRALRDKGDVLQGDPGTAIAMVGIRTVHTCAGSRQVTFGSTAWTHECLRGRCYIVARAGTSGERYVDRDGVKTCASSAQGCGDATSTRGTSVRGRRGE